MFKLNFKLLILFVWALSIAPTVNAEMLLCNKIGFFSDFLQEKLPLTGNCDDPDQSVMLRLAPRGLELTGLGNNRPILLKLSSDTSATANGIKQFGISGHTGQFTLSEGAMLNIHLQNADGGNCDVIAKGGSRCVYEVATTTCALDLLIGDKVCAACATPCKDYSGPITVYVQGQPVRECTVTLKRVSTRCVNCTGKAIAPKE